MTDQNRTYRHIAPPPGLSRFEVRVEETDLSICARRPMATAAKELILQSRGLIESYIKRFPEFVSTLLPWKIKGPAPEIIRAMAFAGQKTGVGPMAAVAGAVAEYVGRGLMGDSAEMIVENGGDIFVSVSRPVTIGIWAGTSSISRQLGLRITPGPHPVGVCTSSGTVGHSLSLGRADAVTIVSGSCCLADAAATAVANQIRYSEDIRPAVDWARGIAEVDGGVIIQGETIAAWGALDLIPL